LFSLKENLKFININQNYLKYLHESCPEVYYKQSGYESKPYLGILVNTENYEYVVPLSSAKEKHKTWKNVDQDRFVIYENCPIAKVSEKDIFVQISENEAKHILSVIDLKKMIPVKKGVYDFVNINPDKNDSLDTKKYKILLNLEYTFCLKIIGQIITKISRLYEKQAKTGKIIKFCCDFKLLEQKCDEWK